MKKWYDEEYEFQVEVTGFLRGDHTERYCRNGEEVGDKYTCTYGCPVNAQGWGICSKTMMMLYPLMEAVRSGGDLENLGGDGKYSKTIVCPDGCVMFRLTARTANDDGCTMESTVLNKEQPAQISRAAGDQLQVTFAHTKGSVDVTVGMDGKEPLYKGAAQENAECSLLVSEPGVYRITVTGHQAKGRVAFIRVPQAAE